MLTLAAAAASAGTAGAAAIPRFGHVFVIVGENTSASQVTTARAPYLARTLRRSGAWIADYRTFPRSHSLGQYMAMVSGRYTSCEAANKLPSACGTTRANLFAQLAASGRTWRSWHESMPAPCHRRDAGEAGSDQYVAHHNPALYFRGLAATCAENDLPMGASTGARDTGAFDAALVAGDVGDFNLVVPDNCDDGHEECGGDDPVRRFDRFLRREVPRIQASPAFGRRGVIVVTYDEGDGSSSRVAAVVLGPHVRPGSTASGRIDHYGLERTLAAGFRLPPLARARSARAIGGIWR